MRVGRPAMVITYIVYTIIDRILQFAEFLRLGFPKSDHVSNSNTIAHVIAFGKTSCKNFASLI